MGWKEIYVQEINEDSIIFGYIFVIVLFQKYLLLYSVDIVFDL